jgi:hypothetical protein
LMQLTDSSFWKYIYSSDGRNFTLAIFSGAERGVRKIVVKVTRVTFP